MKANEFVKKFGLGEAKHILAVGFYHHEVDVYLIDTKEFVYIAIAPDENDPYVSLKDLKRIVESHEVISAFGGIHMAKADLMDLDGFEKTSPYWIKIKQAVLDVESCNE